MTVSLALKDLLQLGAEAPAIIDGTRVMSRETMGEEVRTLARRFKEMNVKVVATLMDNCPAWLISDYAALVAEVVHIPVPLFFSPSQVAHALQSAGVDTVLTVPSAAAHWPELPRTGCTVAGTDLLMMRMACAGVQRPGDSAKITFTSGSTGLPKGVCLSVEAMRAVSSGLVEALKPLNIKRHLCALPLAVLLENIAGVMAPLEQGASCIVLPLEQVGLKGSSTFDPGLFQAAVAQYQPNSVILLPQMLRAWVGFLALTGQRAPQSLRLVAVGGAAVGAKLLQAAHSVGIPAYEGYGLSEGSSVQTLNLPGATRPGSAGRALPHARLRISTQGEIQVAGSLYSGYLGSSDPHIEWLSTGDIGHIDNDGYLFVDGRKKHVLITAYGRNVSPEWVETALRSENSVLQAVVFGDGQTFLSAVLWPVGRDATDAALQAAVDAANASLPDYARVRHWVRGAERFDTVSGMATANGRPRRSAIFERHRALLQMESIVPTPSSLQ